MSENDRIREMTIPDHREKIQRAILVRAWVEEDPARAVSSMLMGVAAAYANAPDADSEAKLQRMIELLMQMRDMLE